MPTAYRTFAPYLLEIRELLPSMLQQYTELESLSERWQHEWHCAERQAQAPNHDAAACAEANAAQVRTQTELFREFEAFLAAFACLSMLLAVGEGTLYPALHRLEERGWIDANWGVSENNRQAKFYSLTKRGGARLNVETENWRRYAAAVFAALEAQPSSSGA